MRKLMFLVMFCLLVAGSAQAANKIATMGAPNSSGTYAVEAFDDRSVVFASDAGVIKSFEAVSAGDTLTIADCDKTFIVSAATTLTYNLPTASTVGGCEVKFIAADGGAIKKIKVDVASTDKLRGVVNSAAPDTFAIGDAVISPGNTNDTIAVISGGGTIWDVTAIRGTWVDAN